MERNTNTSLFSRNLVLHRAPGGRDSQDGCESSNAEEVYLMLPLVWARAVAAAEHHTAG